MDAEQEKLRKKRLQQEQDNLTNQSYMNMAIMAAAFDSEPSCDSSTSSCDTSSSFDSGSCDSGSV